MHTDGLSRFGDLLQRSRLELGRTQEQLAEAAGVSQRAISDLERGITTNPQLGTAEALITAFKTLRLPAEHLRQLEAARQVTPRLRRHPDLDRAPGQIVQAERADAPAASSPLRKSHAPAVFVAQAAADSAPVATLAVDLEARGMTTRRAERAAADTVQRLMDTRTPPATFAELLQHYRRAAGLTQEELAERAHLSVRGISNLERGVRRLPQSGTLTLLIEALGLEATERAAFAAAARGLVDPSPKTPAKGTALAVPTNLPLALTSFVGRERELVTVRRLLGKARLLTLTGAGGCGKTRLALEAARTLASDDQRDANHADGIWLVELAALSNERHVAQAVATVLGVRERPARPLLESLTAFLGPKHVLLLLDNCEHLLGACAALADSLLRVCPHLRVFATSREALGIAGEQPWRVPSLGLPDPRSRLTLEQAAACEAVQLFVQRAQVARPSFALTAHQVILAAQICRRLDGIPLALELAAARLSVLALDQLATRLDDRFRLLIGGSRTALPRQQTLRATLDWSYDLLSEPERQLLQRLSVFAGGWTLDAAEAVCAGDGIAPEAVLDLLAGLVAKSLVLLEEGSTDARYRMLETVRQYGREKLEATGDAGPLQDRHLAWYLALAQQAEAGLGGPEQEGWLARLEGELENLRAALFWSSLHEGRRERGLRLAAALRGFWVVRGYLSEGQHWLEDFLQGESAAGPRARALDALGEMVWTQGHCERAVALFEQAFVLHGQEGQRASAAHALLAQGMATLGLGDLQRGARLIEEALPLLREQGERHGVGWALASLGGILQAQGDLAAAAARYEASLALFRELGHTYGSSWQLASLANVALNQGQHEQARRLYRESLQLRRALLDKVGCAECFEGLAAAAAAEEQPLRAARLIGAAHSLREALGTPGESDRTAFERAAADVQQALGAEAFAAAWAAGQALALEEAIALALEIEPTGEGTPP